MNLDDLIAKLEAAETPSDHLDFAIAEQVGTLEEPEKDLLGSPPYTYSIDAALTLIPADGWMTYAVDGPAMDNCAGLWTWMLADGERDTHATSNDPCIALCIAALKARKAMEEE